MKSKLEKLEIRYHGRDVERALKAYPKIAQYNRMKDRARDRRHTEGGHRVCQEVDR